MRELPRLKKSVCHVRKGRDHALDEIVVLELEDAEAGCGPRAQIQILSPMAA